MNFTEEDILLIRKFDEIRQRGYYCDSKQLNDVYCRVLNKNVAPTGCGSCMRQRIQELVNALNAYEKEQKKAQEALKEQEPTVVKEEENKEPTEEKKKRATKKKKE